MYSILLQTWFVNRDYFIEGDDLGFSYMNQPFYLIISTGTVQIQEQPGYFPEFWIRIQGKGVAVVDEISFRDISSKFCVVMSRFRDYFLSRNFVFTESSRESYSQNRRVLYPSILWLFYVWTNRKKRNISYFFAIGWNRRALYPWVCTLRLWDWGQGPKNEGIMYF
jgi:hypothetical protein